MYNNTDIITKLDEVLLLHHKFQYGLSNATLWRSDKTGQTWCACLDTPGEAVLWYKEKPGGGLEGTGRTMLRQEFKEMFT